jgi:hypothetical protein
LILRRSATKRLTPPCKHNLNSSQKQYASASTTTACNTWPLLQLRTMNPERSKKTRSRKQIKPAQDSKSATKGQNRPVPVRRCSLMGLTEEVVLAFWDTAVAALGGAFWAHYDRLLFSKWNLSHNTRPISTSATAKTIRKVVLSRAIGHLFYCP